LTGVSEGALASAAVAAERQINGLAVFVIACIVVG
jgi:hypothetical protein